MKDIGTFAGSSAAVLAVVNVVQHTTGWFDRWFALAVAIAIATGTTFLIKGTKDLKVGPKIFSSVITGFMLYCSAFGIQNSVIADAPSAPTMHHMVPVVHEEIAYARSSEAFTDDILFYKAMELEAEAEEAEKSGDLRAAKNLRARAEELYSSHAAMAAETSVVGADIEPDPDPEPKPDVRQFRSKW